jgi:glutaminase
MEVSPRSTVDLRPDRAPMSPIVALLERLRVRYQDVTDGAVATYIPELARVDPDRFAIAIATVDGALYAVGDADTRFTIQSMSKPLTYAAALEAAGEPFVRSRIGVEPTGDAFNAITLSPNTGMPLNPMVNAGAIAATGIVPDHFATPTELDFASEIADDPLFALYQRFAGRALTIDQAVYRSEGDTGHRNRAIAHLLKGTGAIDGDPDHVVDRYFKCCSVEVDVRDLAVIAATFASGGINPLTKQRAASHMTTRSVLSVMATCGMYDGAGEWFHTVGLPAKSGVSGGIIAVLPGQMGIAVWSPRLDARGNSVRGLAVFRELSKTLGLSLVGAAQTHVVPVRGKTTVAARHSKRVRSPEARATLATEGVNSLLLELQGDLDFGPVEVIIRSVLANGTPDAVVLDLHRADRLDPRTAGILADLALTLGGTEQPALAWSGWAARHAEALDAIDQQLLASGGLPCPRFHELDAAIEWCEDGILGQRAIAGPPPVVELADHAGVAGLSAAQIAALEGIMRHRTWVAGELIVRRGTPARELYLLTRGEASVTVPLGTSGTKRLSTVTAGMVLGELAFLGSETRTADVSADSLVEAWVLDSDSFAELGRTDPALQAAILTNLLRIVAGMAKRMTQEIALLAG